MTAKPRPPGAIAFTRKQASFGELVLRRTREKIDLLEANEDTPEGVLEDLYDEEYYWSRFVRHMKEQREHLRDKYFGGDDEDY